MWANFQISEDEYKAQERRRDQTLLKNAKSISSLYFEMHFYIASGKNNYHIICEHRKPSRTYIFDDEIWTVTAKREETDEKIGSIKYFGKWFPTQEALAIFLEDNIKGE